MAVNAPTLPFSALRLRIGVDLGRTPDGKIAVHAVALRGTRVRWHAEQLLSPEEPLSRSLGVFLSGLPGSRAWLPRHVAVALGPSFVQLKRLPGLPPLTDRRELGAAVRTNAARFFLRNGVPLATSTLRVDGPGLAWGAATERPVLDEIAAACRSAGLRLTAVVPTGAVLGAITTGYAIGDADGVSTTVAWQDGTDRYGFTYLHGQLVASQRSPRAISTPTTTVALTSTRPAHSVGRAFAGAYGAAIAWRGEPVAWHPAYDPALPANRRARVRAWSVLVIALVAALATPGLSATLSARRAAAHVRAGAVHRRTALATRDSLARATAALAQVTQFSATRRPATFTLRALTNALPKGSALLALQIDSAGGTLVALAPKTAALVAALASDPFLGNVEVVGPVTRESVPGTPVSGSPTPPPRDVERVTVRFRFAKASP
jgi:hypothetical protein